MHPVVTVIMPSHNSERFIEESIDSVINQTFEEWELIVIDDASTDGTLELLEEHRRKDERATFKTPRRGERRINRR